MIIRVQGNASMLEADKTLSAADAAPGKWEQCLSLYKSSDFMVSILHGGLA